MAYTLEISLDFTIEEHAKYFKEMEGGQQKMCKAIEDMKNEAVEWNVL